MSLFYIIAFDHDNSAEKRAEYREAHLEYLQALNQKGQLFSAGPLLTSEEDGAADYGSVLIVDFDNQQAAEQWFANDPFCQVGVYKEVCIKPYLDAMPYC